MFHREIVATGMLVKFGYFLVITAVVHPIVVAVDSLPWVEPYSGCGFGYELLEHRLDQLEQTLRNSTAEVRSILSKQNTLLEKLLNSLSVTESPNNANQLQPSQLLDHQVKHQQRIIKPCEEATSTGRYRLLLPNNGSAPITVNCDTEVHDGAWLVIQQRLDGSVDFNRSWAEYRDGFGIVGPKYEFWLGLEAIHQLTKAGDHELLVELKNKTGHYGYAGYGRFQVAGEDEAYKLTSLSEYSGTLGDQMYYNQNSKFSTYDRDNDNKNSLNCAQHFGTGWWLNACSFVFLNGPYKKNYNAAVAIRWYGWTDAATYSRMMIRRKNT